MAHEFRSGAKLPEERRLAKQLGVSRFTIRQALSVLDAQGLVQRVPNKGTFVTGTGSQNRWFSSAPAILLVRAGPVAASTGPPPGTYYARIYDGVEQAAKSMGLELKVEGIVSPVSVPLQRYHPPQPSEVGGVLVCGTFDEQYISMFRSERAPVVAIDYWSSSLETDCVAVDVDAEASAIVDHLVSRGHTSLGFVGVVRYDRQRDIWELDPDIRRLLGSLRHYGPLRGIQMRDEWIVMHHEGWQGQTLRGLLASKPRPTAIVCFSDDPTRATMRALKEVNLRCPQDISLITRGEPNIDGRQITCLAGDPEEMGRLAVRLLVERMKGQRTCTVKLAVCTRLLQGTSTGPAPSRKTAR